MLRWEVDPDLPKIEADPVRLRQILLNLLSNASKFTERGFIVFRLRRQGSDHILVSVQDTGIGIAEKDFARLFTAFEQVDSNPSRAVGGTGLGLPIVRELVHLHHGRVWLESTVGKGSTFYIELPIRQPQTNNALETTNANNPSRYLPTPVVTVPRCGKTPLSPPPPTNQASGAPCYWWMMSRAF
jgi:signal transduction histidine kinase